MIKILLSVFLFISLIDAKTITVWGEDRALSKIDARKKALENAKAVASEQLSTKVHTSYLDIQKEVNGKYSSTMTISQNFQTSKAILEVIEILDETIKESPYTSNFGSIIEVRIKVKFKVIKEKKKKIIKKKIEPLKPIQKEIKPKKKVIQNYNNIEVSLLYNGRNKFFTKIDKSILIMPINEFYKIKKWKKQFSKKSRFYKKIEKYLYRFKSKIVQKRLKKGNYKTLLLLGKDFLISEKFENILQFQDLTIKDKILKQSYEIFDNRF